MLSTRLYEAAIDGGSEARVVQTDGEVAGVLAGVFPGCADVSESRGDAVVGGLLAALREWFKGDSAFEGEGFEGSDVAAVFLSAEMSDDSHDVLSFSCWRPPNAASLTATEQRTAKRPGHSILERSAREEAEGRGECVIDARERRSHIGRLKASPYWEA